MGRSAFSIIAATCYGNRGAQAMVETVIGRLGLERDDLAFHLFSYYPREDRRLVTHPRVSVHSSTPLALIAWLLPSALLFGLLRRLFGQAVLRLAPRSIRALAGSVALVDLAGVSFIDGREKFLPFNVLTIMTAWLLGTPVVKMPQAVGPFRGRLNRLAARLALPMCRMVWARGAQTRAHLEAASFARVRFAAADDIAFNHDPAFSLTEESGEALQQLMTRLAALRSADNVRGAIGICPSAVVAAKSRRAGGRYEEMLSALVIHLSEKGYVVALFPNATRASAGAAERNNDLPLIRRIRASSQRSRAAGNIVAFDLDINASGIKRVIASMDVVLVSRFHAMVGALALGIPPGVLGWSHKYSEVMERFGLAANALDYAELGATDLATRVEALFETRHRQQETIRAHLPGIKASAEKPVLGLLSADLGCGIA